MQTLRRGAMVVTCVACVDVEAVVAALFTPGETIKVSRKSITRRVGDWVIKESRLERGLGVVKHTLARSRYRTGWRAAQYLAARGVPIPVPIGYIEWRVAGVIARNAFICEYLNCACNVEHHAKALHQAGAPQQEIATFLAGIADAVNALNAAGAYHADLSGKNLFTRGGEEFFFIDLDGVQVGATYTEARRFKNHVQLYDSFCDIFGDDLLGPFLARMLPDGRNAREWTAQVRAGQRERRAIIEAKWRKQGKC